MKTYDGTKPFGGIEPKDIDTSKHLWDAFGHNETEVSAHYIVKLCQQKGGWVPVTKAELDAIAKEDYHFNKLLQNGWVTELERNPVCYLVTNEFVWRCYKSSPVKD